MAFGRTYQDSFRANVYKPQSKVKNERLVVTTFQSMGEFMNYITNTPLNKNSQFTSLSSSNTYNGCEDWYGTIDYDTAVNLAKYGEETSVEALMKELKVQSSDIDKVVTRIGLDVAGFMPCVPNYLSNNPMAMFNTKIVPKKQKIITLNKCIDYSGMVSAKEIVEYSVRTLRIIKSLEAKGYAINLNVLDGRQVGRYMEMVKVRIKNAGERTNVSKLGFALTNPAMLRRMLFRYCEVAETTEDMTSSTSMGEIIGACIPNYYYKEQCKADKEIYLDRRVTEQELNEMVELKWDK